MNSYYCELDPLVSIIIPAYNAESFIQETLFSIVQQTYQKIEIIVVDDGSKDNTNNLIKSFALSDSRITVMSQSNSGVSAARNLGIEKSKGEFIAFIDADDIYSPCAIEKLTSTMLQADDSVGVVYGWTARIDEKTSLTGKFTTPQSSGNIYQEILRNDFVASATLVRKKCIDRVGNFNCSMRFGCEDWDFYLRLSEHYLYKAIPEFIYGYREVYDSTTYNCSKMEHGYQQYIAEACKRNTEISTEVVNSILASSFLYLSSKNRAERKFLDSIKYIIRAWSMYPEIRHNFYFHQVLKNTLLEIILFPIVFLLWHDFKSWIRFKQKLKTNFYQVFGFPPMFDLANESFSKII